MCIRDRRYTMELVYEHSPEDYTRLRRRMTEATFAAFRAAGGGARAQQPGRGMQAAFAALGVGDAACDYEILALYLASRLPL